MLINSRRVFPTAEERIWPRLQCELVTECIVFGKQWPCKIIDLSELGFGIIADISLHKGDIVEIADPCSRTEVVWAEERKAGLRTLN
jgi:hypothetical protein